MNKSELIEALIKKTDLNKRQATEAIKLILGQGEPLRLRVFVDRTVVEVFANGIKLGEDAASPYEFTWTDVAAGSYTLTALAIDNNNATTVSIRSRAAANPWARLPQPPI